MDGWKIVTSWCLSSSSSLLSVIGLPHTVLSQQLPLAFFLLLVWILIIACAIHGPWPRSGPGFVGGMDLAESSPPVEIELVHEHCAFMLLFSDEFTFLHPEVLVPGSEVGCGANGGRMPCLASEAIRDLRL